MTTTSKRLAILISIGFLSIFLSMEAAQASTSYICPDPASFKQTTWDKMIAFEGTNATVAGKVIAGCPGNNDVNAPCKTLSSAPKAPKYLSRATFYTSTPLFLCYYDTALVVTQFNGGDCHFKKPDGKDPTQCTVGGVDACTLVCN